MTDTPPPDEPPALPSAMERYAFELHRRARITDDLRKDMPADQRNAFIRSLFLECPPLQELGEQALAEYEETSVDPKVVARVKRRRLQVMYKYVNQAEGYYSVIEELATAIDEDRVQDAEELCRIAYTALTKINEHDLEKVLGKLWPEEE